MSTERHEYISTINLFYTWEVREYYNQNMTSPPTKYQPSLVKRGFQYGRNA
jgi:hypothetical protein